MAQGYSFFCRRVEIPGDVKSDELDSFLQLQLESLSPFPLEHLQFGFVIDASRHCAFLYAAYRRSFEHSVASSWEEQEAVIPEFSVGLLAGGLDDETPLLIEGGSSFTYLEFDSLSELPRYFPIHSQERQGYQRGCRTVRFGECVGEAQSGAIRRIYQSLES